VTQALVLPPITKRQRVVIAYHFIAHYREAVFRELIEHGRHDYILASDRNYPFTRGIALWDIPADVPHAPLQTRKISKLEWHSGLLSLAWREDIDQLILLGNAAWPAFWLAAILARLRGKRVFFWSHGWLSPEKGLHGRIRSTFYRLAHGLLLYGHFAKCHGIRLGFDPDSIHVIYNSLDYPAQVTARNGVTDKDKVDVRRELFGDERTPVVICSARLTPERRLDQLLQAVGKLSAEGSPVNVILVGDGPARASLEAEAKLLGVNVCFYGPCYDEPTLARLTMASNATVSPGNVGLTAMQSLAFGTPVITHGDPNGQKPEFEVVVPGRTGALFTKGDVDDLARAIGRLTQSQWIDPATRQACIAHLERLYTPAVQRALIERAIDGLPANDVTNVDAGRPRSA
jgi:glycosyltransferase involved in cell wall biosynthesis